MNILRAIRYRRAIARRLREIRDMDPACRECVVAGRAGREVAAAHRYTAHRFDRRPA